jgi:hypothetical protein
MRPPVGAPDQEHSIAVVDLTELGAPPDVGVVAELVGPPRRQHPPERLARVLAVGPAGLAGQPAKRSRPHRRGPGAGPAPHLPSAPPRLGRSASAPRRPWHTPATSRSGRGDCGQPLWTTPPVVHTSVLERSDTGTFRPMRPIRTQPTPTTHPRWACSAAPVHTPGDRSTEARRPVGFLPTMPAAAQYSPQPGAAPPTTRDRVSAGRRRRCSGGGARAWEPAFDAVLVELRALVVPAALATFILPGAQTLPSGVASRLGMSSKPEARAAARATGRALACRYRRGP